MLLKHSNMKCIVPDDQTIGRKVWTLAPPYCPSVTRGGHGYSKRSVSTPLLRKLYQSCLLPQQQDSWHLLTASSATTDAAMLSAPSRDPFIAHVGLPGVGLPHKREAGHRF